MSRWMNRRVLVLGGGTSSERPVSLRTSEAVIDGLRAAGYTVEFLDFSPSRVGALLELRPDVVFLGLHGGLGEGGAVQGLLECMEIPYTGSGVMASALAMDKVRSKLVFRSAGVPTPRWAVVPRGGAEAPADFPLPAVVKPSVSGSSVGLTILRDASGWGDALETCWKGEGDALVEAFITGDELSVGFLDDALLGTVRIRPAGGVYDYAAKYERGDTVYEVPARMAPGVLDAAVEAARGAWRVLGCRGAGRVDVLVDGSGAPFVLEVNTLPGMTATSLVPKMAAARGISFSELVGRMLEAATTDERARAGGGE